MRRASACLPCVALCLLAMLCAAQPQRLSDVDEAILEDLDDWEPDNPKHREAEQQAEAAGAAPAEKERKKKADEGKACASGLAPPPAPAGLPDIPSLATWLAPVAPEKFWRDMFQKDACVHIQPSAAERPAKARMLQAIWSWKHVSTYLWSHQRDMIQDYKRGINSVDVIVDAVQQFSASLMKPSFEQVYKSYTSGATCAIACLRRTPETQA